MKAYQVNVTKTRQMLSIFLGKLGYDTMANDVLHDRESNLPQYARTVIHNLRGKIKTKFETNCRLIQLI
jgi:hypothetical protein